MATAAAPPKASSSSRTSRKKTPMRQIGRWYIGETLGKGGYSWVKKGYDNRTGKAVALKFMKKADQSWADEQKKQVVTEIEALKQISHPNIMKLYAYNMHAKYPTKDKSSEKLDVILLVLEYAPGGELFDILYYTRQLEPPVARTYFQQMMLGLEACHKAGVAHRDIKPQNLLLDARFQLKITDFGLSKVAESDRDAIMKTSYVGTRGYQAPELLLNRPYTVSCDIFSAGVVLFILLTGYPPFEQAQKKDRWYAPLIQGDVKRFWKAHRGCGVDREAKDLLTRMLTFAPEKRITIEQIKNHVWHKHSSLDMAELVNILRLRHRKMEIKRRNDAKKAADLQDSIKKRALGLPSATWDKEAHDWPEDQEIKTIRDVHTCMKPYFVLNWIHDWVQNNQGNSEFDEEDFSLHVTFSEARFETPASITIRVWRDPEMSEAFQHELKELRGKEEMKQSEGGDDQPETNIHGDVNPLQGNLTEEQTELGPPSGHIKYGHSINVVQFIRGKGTDSILFQRILRWIFDKFAYVLSGLPIEDKIEEIEEANEEYAKLQASAKDKRDRLTHETTSPVASS
jgi:serine/threonine protein kinase